jgi:hypothetical protein
MATVAVDFDGVIHTYSRGWADGSIYDPPLPGAIEALRGLMVRYAVFVHTTRDPWPAAQWLDAHGLPAVIELTPTGAGVAVREFWNDQSQILVTNRKLPAVAYIDDRAVRFANWPQALRDLERYEGGGCVPCVLEVDR